MSAKHRHCIQCVCLVCEASETGLVAQLAILDGHVPNPDSASKLVLGFLAAQRQEDCATGVPK
jgi:hypothetical protein